MTRPKAYSNMNLWQEISRFESLRQEVIFIFSITILFVIALIAFLMRYYYKKDRKIYQIDEESRFDPPPEYSEEVPPPTYDEAVIIEKTSSNGIN